LSAARVPVRTRPARLSALGGETRAHRLHRALRYHRSRHRSRHSQAFPVPVVRASRAKTTRWDDSHPAVDRTRALMMPDSGLAVGSGNDKPEDTHGGRPASISPESRHRRQRLWGRRAESGGRPCAAAIYPASGDGKARYPPVQALPHQAAERKTALRSSATKAATVAAVMVEAAEAMAVAAAVMAAVEAMGCPTCARWRGRDARSEGRMCSDRPRSSPCSRRQASSDRQQSKARRPGPFC